MNKKDYKELFQAMNVRTRMYLSNGTYGEFVAFLNGCDLVDGLLLCGFRRWVAKELGLKFETSLTYCSLILNHVFPNQNIEDALKEYNLDYRKNHQLAIDTLVNFLVKFIDSKECLVKNE